MQIPSLPLWLHFVSVAGGKSDKLMVYAGVSMDLYLCVSHLNPLPPGPQGEGPLLAQNSVYIDESNSVLLSSCPNFSEVATCYCHSSDLFLIFKKDKANKSLNTCICLHFFFSFFSFTSVCSLSHLPVHCWKYPNWVSMSKLFLRTT